MSIIRRNRQDSALGLWRVLPTDYSQLNLVRPAKPRDALSRVGDAMKIVVGVRSWQPPNWWRCRSSTRWLELLAAFVEVGQPVPPTGSVKVWGYEQRLVRLSLFCQL